MEHVLTMANLKLKPSLFTPRPNRYIIKPMFGGTQRMPTLLQVRSEVQTWPLH